MKNYYIQQNIGRCKYVVSYCDGVQTHLDGSPMYRIAIFRNKIKLNTFITELTVKGYRVRQ